MTEKLGEREKERGKIPEEACGRSPKFSKT